MATYPQAAIPVFAAGYPPTPPVFGQWAQAPFQFLTQLPLFRAIQQVSGGQALSSGTIDPLQVGATAGDILEDPYAGWSTTTTSAQAAWSWLAPYTGLYEVTISVPVKSSTVWLNAAVAVSGAAPYWMESAQMATGADGGCSGSLIVGCTGGQDYIQAGTAVSAAATTDTTQTYLLPSLEIAYVSSG